MLATKHQRTIFTNELQTTKLHSTAFYILLESGVDEDVLKVICAQGQYNKTHKQCTNTIHTSDRSFRRQIATAGCCGWSLHAMMMMMMMTMTFN